MATAAAPNEPGATPKAAGGKFVDYGSFIDRQLHTTRKQVKAVEVAGGLLTLAIAAVGFFLLAAVLDHWILSGGLGVWGRLLGFVALAAGGLYFLASAIVPPLVGRVNPVYAAHTIERSRPTLKNGLINFLLFRRRREGLPQTVYNALEEQAATGLVNVQVESAVDRTRLIHAGYLLVALVAAFALYLVLSPKNPLKTAARVILPWADIAAPARVSIEDVRPGSTSAFRGQGVKVSAEVVGLGSGDQVKLIYSTADRQVVDRVIVMYAPPDGYRHTAVLPETDSGLQQNVDYRIVAGDASTSTYHLEALEAPAIVVDSVEYKYPAYTGLATSSARQRGDLKAIEGTEVTLRAAANQPIKLATVDFQCDGRADRTMQVAGEAATIRFPLAMNEARNGPQYESYQLRMVNDQGVENPQPIRHRIEVLPDLPPEVSFLSPVQEEVAVPVDGELMIELRAIDPDFALSRVALRAASGRGELLNSRDAELLLNAPHRGPFVAKYLFSPARLKLKEGDVVRYSAEAVDNKTPEGNRTATAERRIRVVAAENLNQRRQADPSARNQRQQPPQDQQQRPRSDDRQANQQPQAPGRDPQDQPQDGQGDNNQQDRQQGNQQNQAGGNQDQGGESNAQQQKQKQDGEGQQDPQQQQDGKRDEGQNAADQNQDGQKQDGQQQQGDKQQSGKEQSKGQQQQHGQQPQSGQQQGGNQQGQQQQGDSKQGQQGQQNSPPSGKAQSQQSGQQQNDQSGAGQSSDSKSGRQRQQQPGVQSQKDGERQQAEGQSNGDQRERNAQRPDQSAAPADGSDDGRGLERILDDQKQQGGETRQGQQQKQPAGQSGERGDEQAKGQQPGDQQPRGSDSQTADDKVGGDTAAEQQPNQRRQRTEQDKATDPGNQQPDANAQRPQRDQSGGPRDPSEQQQGDEKPKADDGQQDRNSRHGLPQSAQPESGAQTQPQADSAKGHANPGEDPHTPQSKGEQPGSDGKQPDQSAAQQNTRGNPGAGTDNPDDKGSPSPQQNLKPVDKQSSKDGTQKDGGSEAQSPATNTRESDSRGQDDGDKAGGGGKGGGQNADQQGTGGAGKNTANDRGAGAANELGKGETSNKAGQDQKSDGKTGQSSNERGQGSETRATDDPNAQAADRAPADDSREQSSGKQQGQQAGNQNSDKGSQSQNTGRDMSSGGTGGGGQPHDNIDSPERDPFSPLKPDDPNLAYAKKATQLALDHLKDAMRNGNEGQELLNELGWSREEAEQFIRRQEQRLRDAARSNPNDEARREAEDALLSLGLRPNRTERTGVDVTSDQQRGMSTGRRTAPPPEYAEQYKAYTQGINQGK